jgi:Fic family protein
MTTREFYTAVVEANINEELSTKAQELIAALDAKNEKRKATETKEQKEAAARAAAVLAFLKEQTEPVTRDTIAGVLDMSPAQASAACKALGEAVTKTEIKVDKARKVAYTFAGFEHI